jgi:two-component system, LuxR family, response regulator FixJ
MRRGGGPASWQSDQIRQQEPVGQQLDITKPVVVIVDDDLAVRSSLAFSLRTEGIAVRAYVDAAELLMDMPDAACFVIDYKLPGMNGLDLLAELRRREVRAPAILITTHPSAAVRERAAADGMALIEKPLLGDALFREIRSALAM